MVAFIVVVVVNFLNLHLHSDELNFFNYQTLDNTSFGRDDSSFLKEESCPFPMSDDSKLL